MQNRTANTSKVTKPPVASTRATPSKDESAQRRPVSSIDCLHAFARLTGRYPRLGLFTPSDEEDDIEPKSDAPLTLDHTPLVPVSREIEEDEMKEHEVEDEDDEDDDEYIPTLPTSRASRIRNIDEAVKTGMPEELPAMKRGEESGRKPVKRRNSSSNESIETDPKTGTGYVVVKDKDGKVLRCRCPDHPDLKCSTKGDMGRHLQSRDHQPPSYHCAEFCGKVFTRIDALRRHVKGQHPGTGLVVVENETGAETIQRKR